MPKNDIFVLSYKTFDYVTATIQQHNQLQPSDPPSCISMRAWYEIISYPTKTIKTIEIQQKYE